MPRNTGVLTIMPLEPRAAPIGSARVIPDSCAWRAFAEGIGHPGQYYLVRMELQLGFIVDFARRLKEEPTEKRAGNPRRSVETARLYGRSRR